MTTLVGIVAVTMDASVDSFHLASVDLETMGPGITDPVRDPKAQGNQTIDLNKCNKGHGLTDSLLS